MKKKCLENSVFRNSLAKTFILFSCLCAFLPSKVSSGDLEERIKKDVSYVQEQQNTIKNPYEKEIANLDNPSQAKVLVLDAIKKDKKPRIREIRKNFRDMYEKGELDEELGQYHANLIRVGVFAISAMGNYFPLEIEISGVKIGEIKTIIKGINSGYAFNLTIINDNLSTKLLLREANIEYTKKVWDFNFSSKISRNYFNREIGTSASLSLKNKWFLDWEGGENYSLSYTNKRSNKPFNYTFKFGKRIKEDDDEEIQDKFAEIKYNQHFQSWEKLFKTPYTLIYNGWNRIFNQE